MRCSKQEQKIMWTTVLLVFSSLTFTSNAQGSTNFDAQGVTDSTQPNQGIKWDTTGPSVTLSIRDGRSNNRNGHTSERPTPSLFYSNEWQPYLMPMVGYGNRQSEDAGDDSVNYQFMPTLLRRPESEMNQTSSRQSNFNTGLGTSLSTLPIPMAQISPMFYYPPPPPPSAFFNTNTFTTSSSNTLNDSTTPTARPVLLESDKSNIDVQRDSISSPHFGLLPEDFERYPFDFYRRGNFFIPHPAFTSPYSILSSANGNYLPPSLYPFTPGPIYDRQTGAEAKDTNTAGQNVPETENPVASGDIQEHDTEVVNGTPSDASSAFVPPEPLRLPLGAYPFGIMPSPILPNLFPNLPPSAGLPIQPLANDASFQKDSLFANAFAAQPPIPNNIPLEPAPIGLLSPNPLVSNAELPPAIDTNVEGAPPEEQASPAKIPYEFGFDMNDGKGTDQHRKEVSDVSGTVRGSYGYRDMFGVYRIVNYIADKNGFRAVIKSNEPGVASSGSANVVVMAEQPPPQTIAEGQKLQPDAIIVPDAASDLIAEGSSVTDK